MFSSYVVTSVVADDGLPEIKYRTRYNNASIDINQVRFDHNSEIVQEQ